MVNDRNQNLQNLLLELQQELEKRQNTLNCPHCGGSLTLVSGGASAAAQPRRARGSRKTAALSRATAKVTRRKRGGRRPSELVSLAMRYARERHNGRIGDAYRDVKRGIAKQVKGKKPPEVKALKAQWFKEQLA